MRVAMSHIAFVGSLAIHGAVLAAGGATLLLPPQARTVGTGGLVDLLTIDLETADGTAVPPPSCPAAPTTTAIVVPVREVPIERRPVRPAPARLAAAPGSASPAPEHPATPAIASAAPPPSPAVIASENGSDGNAMSNGGSASANPTSSAGPGSRGAGGPGSTGGTPNGPGAGDGMLEYGRAVYSRIVANVRYPERATRENRQGTVILQLVLETDGRLREATAIGGVNDPLLREAARDAVYRAAPFPPPPRQVVEQGGPVAFRVPIRFFLQQR